ncbi:MAG TPA: hypothetical protein VFW96_25975, partial [Thermomicrobiales bacterium]|nr:hypothetical protein [Thermomicrobiales bacterium]
IQGALADGRRAARQAAAPAVPFTKTARHYRGQTLRALGALGRGERLTLDALGPLVRPDYTAAERPWLYTLVAGLARDGLVAVTGETADGRRQTAEVAGPSHLGEEYHAAPSCSPPGLGGPGGAAVREEPAPYAAAPGPDLAAVRVSLPES